MKVLYLRASELQRLLSTVQNAQCQLQEILPCRRFLNAEVPDEEQAKQIESFL